ncbi:J domain-containing protein [Natronomonas gomsonensis]|uniref:J domain-containing protein n=1 Tax=Natronomonas gomsonensis TaxID=1046043 RepID=UPI0020CA40DD|nr:J domain-containing protein [Natronomonas gomsonensis]MCY4731848.1 J domain-containing protein [Natronomonas gomsonensis]
MQKERLVLGLTVVFGAMTALVLLLSIALVEPVLFFVALPLGAAAYMFWYHSSGKLRERVARSQPGARSTGEGRGGFGAGPRSGFDSARGQQAREEWERRQHQRQQRERRQRADVGPSPGLSRAEAYRRLGLDTDADEGEIRRAYRERIKEAHPDRGGDEAEFKRLTEAYETLTE